MVTPSGQQLSIAHGDQRATVAEVGATLRTYTVGERAVVEGFAADAMSTAGRGQILAPWPNRLAGGSYRFGGQLLQLPLTEPHAGNAIHGLVRFANWTVAEAAAAKVVMAHRLHPQPGYPFLLDLRVTYTLGDGGLSVRIEAANGGNGPCPFGAGAHPYLRVGDGGVDGIVLRAPAATWYEADAQGIPVARRAVDGTAYDFRDPRPIGSTVLDTAFTDLERGPDGRAVVDVADRPGGERVRVWLDPGFPYLMLFSADTLRDDERRRSLAIEPMTCPPNAFRTGDGLLVLEPGERFRADWGIAPRGTSPLPTHL